ncbi:hypothetical protein [Anatilimnocola floriformis]|uniref:hypothetical protein n=1 Tax=Anatilimnocola floriformis TaxID=2948575 RepID=UPI0020C54775|nr:hypothetical protein [Anatilimnocola floriformis]
MNPGAVYYQLARQESFSEWWHWLLLLGVIIAIVSYVIWMYRKDSFELATGTAILLGGLRLFALLGILLFFLQLEKRTQKTLVKNSRALLLVDTSQSMGLRDTDSTSVPAMPSRVEQLVLELKSGKLLPELRKQHDVVVYRFDQAEAPVEVASLPKLPSADAEAENRTPQQELDNSLAGARRLAMIAAGVVGAAAIAGLIYLLQGRGQKLRTKETMRAGAEQQSYSLLVSVVCLIVAAVIFGTANLLHPEIGFGAILGLSKPSARSVEKEEKPAELPPIDWTASLLPRGVETRLGDNLKALIDKERGGPIAAIVVFSDGGNNAGLDPTVAATVAADSLVQIYSVGLGSDKRPANIRVVDVEAPEKVFPGDKFTIKGYVQGVGLNSPALTAELVSTDAQGQGEKLEDEKTVNIGTTGQIVPVEFELKPEEQGVRLFKLRIKPDAREIEKRDNEKITKVEIVDRKTKVLLLAGGPTRDFIFLRNQLFRDKESTVDVILQSARPGISQDAHEILTEFPKEPDELFTYDAVIAFDPDWEALDDEQVELLEKFVAEKGGGLIVVAGPVFTPQWSSRRKGDPRIDTIRNLYPVAFYFQGSATLSLGRFGSDKPWPLNFSREGEEAEFLWIDDSAEASKRAWSQFDGVFGYYAVKDPKPGARVYARFSDPDTALDNELPIYFAGQFYGSGRVFFMASGEMWRVRSVEDTYFESFYTRLIRWASEGRRLRDSSRGVLLTDKDRALLGDAIAVRAVLQDAQFKPLHAEQVAATVIQPDSTRIPLVMKKTKDAERQGTFSEQFIALQEGDYQIELQHPAAADQILLRSVRVRMPALETERPERNDKLLIDLTDRAGGKYFVGLDAALQGKWIGQEKNEPNQSLVQFIKPQDQRNVLPGTPDRNFDRLLMTWLMGLICGGLCLEWLIRRLSKLA